MQWEAVFRIAKMAGGQDVWLTATTPFVIWGGRAQAIKYGSSNDARAALEALPPSERVGAIVVIGN